MTDIGTLGGAYARSAGSLTPLERMLTGQQPCVQSRTYALKLFLIKRGTKSFIEKGKSTSAARSHRRQAG
jgi:hypothetical protein